MTAYNFRLQDAVIEALKEAIVKESDDLAAYGGGEAEAQLRLRLGRIQGLGEAVAIAEATAKKHLES